ncbi:DsbA family oxidoreductase [Marinibaculum pumilum]|uniref:DsbA family oxidoreductase n=1 Tax=Marinibaculum pumilum TaxID=1766165 RepID=A0ABV7KUR0_9PROT
MQHTIDIISDTVCPWCLIGKRRFERALAQRPDLDVQIDWRPYQLNPEMPREGVDRKAYLEAKFGGPERAQQIYDNIRDAGAEENIDFDFAAIPKTPNTLDSHRLIRWAASAGVQDLVVERLFQAYFENGEDIGDRQVLLGIAEEAGMDRGLVAELLEDEADTDLIRKEDALARQMGVEGVPCFIIDRKYVVSGAQDPEVFLKAFEMAENDEDLQAEEPVAGGVD